MNLRHLLPAVTLLSVCLFSCEKPNTPPVASFSFSPRTGTVNTVFTFDASTVYDAEDGPLVLKCRWDWENDGIFDAEYSTQKKVLHQFKSPGRYLVAMEVCDMGGLCTAIRREVVVTGSGPVAAFTVRPEIVLAGSPVRVDPDSSRDEETAFENLRCRWDWESDGQYDTEWGRPDTLSHVYPDPGQYTITLLVADGDGLTAEASHTVEVRQPEPDLLVDPRDGQVYQTVKIGGQRWMAQNLNYGSMIPGAMNQGNNRIVEKYCLFDSQEGCEKYGGLYQWNEAMNYNYGNIQGICPPGWHIPTDTDIQVLERYLGISENQLDVLGWRGTDAADKLVVGGSAGFNAIHHGYRKSTGEFTSIDRLFVMWSSTVYDDTTALYRALEKYNPQIYREHWYKTSGYSIRCLRN
jgi:uncharacterized protein (TIGR02145 family)